VIPARHGYVAVYGPSDSSGVFKAKRRLEVVAWDDDGYPMVLPEEPPGDREHRGLTRADALADYDGVEEDPFPRIIALIPAGGWRVEWRNDAGSWSEPLVGWGIRTSGLVDALITDGDGDVRPVDLPGWRIYHPDAEAPREDQ
jgi:hypothetical protein